MQFTLKATAGKGRPQTTAYPMDSDSRLLPVFKSDDIPEHYRETPFESLFMYHNLNYSPAVSYNMPEMLILTCIDHRITLNLPYNFCYMVRNGGAKMDNVAFSIAFAVAVAKIKAIALIGHRDCRMRNIEKHCREFIRGLECQGWKKHKAEKFFKKMQPLFIIKNVADSLKADAARLRRLYPKVAIVPLYYSEKDRKLYLVKENKR